MSVSCATVSLSLGCQSEASRKAFLSSARTSGVSFVVPAARNFLTVLLPSLPSSAGAAASVAAGWPPSSVPPTEGRLRSSSFAGDVGDVGGCPLLAPSPAARSKDLTRIRVSLLQRMIDSLMFSEASGASHSFHCLVAAAATGLCRSSSGLPVPTWLAAGDGEPKARLEPWAEASFKPSFPGWPAPFAPMAEPMAETPDVDRGTPSPSAAVSSAWRPASSIVPTLSSIMNSRSLSILPMSLQVTSTPMRSFSSAEMPYSDRHTHSFSGCMRPTILSATWHEPLPR
mmetsp:Transcript_7950/g.23578  ORF Transcript_7950/g.23578 Transcript_7950/m.23578 type:complete len:285 (-) Transcript_7950:280-1134(-)